MWWGSTVAIACVVLAACRVNFDPLSTRAIVDASDDAADADPDAEVSDAAVSCSPIPSCPVHLGGTLQLGSFSQSMIASQSGTEMGSCGGQATQEASWEYTVLDTATYKFRLVTAGSFVGYVRDVCCAGPELLCTTTPGTIFQLDLVQGQTIVVFVDGGPPNTGMDLRAGDF